MDNLDKSEQKIVQILSLGAGVQSSTMALMAARGEIEPRPEHIVFSDTGYEPPEVYKWLEWLTAELKKYGMEVSIYMPSNIKTDQEDFIDGKRKSVPSIPFFTRNEDGKKGMMFRQCTKNYKIMPVHKKIRELLGYQPRKRIKEKVILWMGISTDEMFRMKPAQAKWIEHRWPLIEKEMSRIKCLQWMESKGYPLPPKSSCVFCPYQSDERWVDWKKNNPTLWQEAVEFDKKIRHYPKFKGTAYVHRSGVPLEDVDFKENQTELDLFDNECEGMCGL